MTKPNVTPYEPTPEQIAESAAAIRSGWSEEQLAKRRGEVSRPLETPVMDCVAFQDGRVLLDSKHWAAI